VPDSGKTAWCNGLTILSWPAAAERKRGREMVGLPVSSQVFANFNRFFKIGGPLRQEGGRKEDRGRVQYRDM
jgi:hypothetical protein